MSLTNFIKNNSKLVTCDEIVFYGGTFNPWHDGHSACVELAPKDLPLIVIPDNNPHKELNSSKDLDLSRLETKLTKIRNDVWIFEEFYTSSRPTPTVEWIEILKNDCKDISLSLLIGFDSFVSLPKWTRVKDLLLSLKSVYVVSRLDENNIKNSTYESLIKLCPDLKIEFVGNHDFENVSSTKLRKL